MTVLLAFLAHPDDESFGIGGTLAKYARAGVDVHYLCATRGESGTVDDHRMEGFSDVAELRDGELACASKALGLKSYEYFGYRDSGMQGSKHNAHADSFAQASVDEAAKRLAAVVLRLRPDVIITHDQYGGYGHPDHIACHKAALRMYEMLWGVRITPGPRGEAIPTTGSATGPITPGELKAPRLYYSTLPKTFIKWGVRFLRLTGQNPSGFGRNKDIDLVKIASWDLPVTAKVDIRDFAEIKREASACHASQQMPQQNQSLFQRIFFRRQTVESFTQAYPAFPAKGRITADLLRD